MGMSILRIDQDYHHNSDAFLPKALAALVGLEEFLSVRVGRVFVGP